MVTFNAAILVCRAKPEYCRASTWTSGKSKGLDFPQKKIILSHILIYKTKKKEDKKKPKKICFGKATNNISLILSSEEKKLYFHRVIVVG